MVNHGIDMKPEAESFVRFESRVPLVREPDVAVVGAGPAGWAAALAAGRAGARTMLIERWGVIGGMGDSARHTWLKLPYCEDFHRVTMATTLPILMLGGPSKEDPRTTYQDFAAGMATRSNVRGALVGRNVSFPGREDPAAVAQAISDIVHRGFSADEAVEVTMAHRDDKMDFLTKHIR